MPGVIQNARNQGIDVEAHIYPYTAGQNAGLTNIIPPWAHESGTPRMLERLKDPALRARLEKDITQGNSRLVQPLHGRRLRLE